ncbi:MAG: class I SAM-dependent methyltransferase [Planktomarina sp.]
MTFPSINGLRYTDVMQRIVKDRNVEWYLEIGCRKGGSIAGMDCNCVAVDPEFAIDRNVIGASKRTHFFQQTSDDFFAEKFLQKAKIQPDLCFVDGLHFFEYALRDVMNAEAAMGEDGIICVHDVCPFDYPMSTRDIDRTKKGLPWTGDVWKTILALKQYRPDLKIEILDAASTGLAVISNLDPKNKVIKRSMNKILREYNDLELETIGAETYYGTVGLQSAEAYRPV